MSTLGESNARTNARLDLTEMYNARHADHFQHAVVVSRPTEFLLFLVAPQIGATGPTENVHDDDAFERGQLDTFAVDFENDVAREIFQAAFLHHLSDARFQIVAFGLNPATNNAVNDRIDAIDERLPAIEFIRILLSRHVKVQADVSIEAQAEVVVHHEHLGFIFIGSTVGGVLKKQTRSAAYKTQG